ncbi:NAD synthetase [Bacteroidia bacterium]|nr:NAD synthetase [Bacteroidia bacterium]
MDYPHAKIQDTRPLSHKESVVKIHWTVQRAVVLTQQKIAFHRDNETTWTGQGLINFDRYLNEDENDLYQIEENEDELSHDEFLALHKYETTNFDDIDTFKIEGLDTGLFFAKELRYAYCGEDYEQIIILEAWSFELKTHKESWSHRNRLLRYQTLASAKDAKFVVANAVGGNAPFIFTGGSLQIAPDGTIIEQLPYFKESPRKDLSAQQPLLLPATEPDMVQMLHEALICGLSDFFNDRGMKQAVIGLSGGIDSAVVCALAVEALGRQNVVGILMPSQYSSQHSVDDAVQLCKNLSIAYHTIPIEQSFKQVHSALEPIFENRPFGLAEENLQARLRACLLMSFSNKFGHIVLNTSNKSEAAMGYGTLYGDLCGALSVLGDLYKTQVYQIARYINRKRVLIPQNTIDKAPSAELRPNQKDSDSLPDYEVLDQILELFIGCHYSEYEIVEKGFDKKTVQKVIALYKASEYKRFQTPPVLRVSDHALGIDVKRHF